VIGLIHDPDKQVLVDDIESEMQKLARRVDCKAREHLQAQSNSSERAHNGLHRDVHNGHAPKKCDVRPHSAQGDGSHFVVVVVRFARCVTTEEGAKLAHKNRNGSRIRRCGSGECVGEDKRQDYVSLV
jgi:hypothetical protein